MSIHPSAIIDPEASVDASASIGPFVVIDGPATIKAECRLEPFAVVKGWTELGRGCHVHSHAVVGDVPQDTKYHGDVTFCRIGDGTVIREGATIHRGTAPGSTTVVGENCLLMTNSHVGHNCTVGDGVTLVSGALLGGHVHVGERAIISGNATVHQFVRIGELALIGMSARIVQDVPPFFITDRDGDVVAYNRIGLTRAGFTMAERQEIKSAYSAIFRHQLGRNAAVEYLEQTTFTDAGCRLLAFLLADSKRGSATRVANRRQAA